MSLAGEIVTYILAAAFLSAAAAKFLGAKMVVESLDRLGISKRLRWGLGGCEVAGAVLLLIPSLTFVGAIGLVVLMVGAAGQHMRIRDYAGALPALALLALCLWVVVESLPAFIAFVS